MSRDFWPGNKELSRKHNLERPKLEVKNCLFEGPSFHFSTAWLFCTYSGVFYLQSYFWILNDFAWSQISWFWTAIFSGTVSVVLGFALIFLALHYRIYSEALVAFGLFLWLLANYWWMFGEIVEFRLTFNSTSLYVPEFIYRIDGKDSFYDRRHQEAQIIMLVAVLWLAGSIFILPFVFYDRNTPVLRQLINESPRYPFRFFFRDFLEYEKLHLFFWSLKDLLYCYQQPIGYVVVLFFTLIFMSDAMYLTATTKGHFVDLIHYFAAFAWVISNAFWAAGELFIEIPREKEISEEEYELYSFIPLQPDSAMFFWARNVSGWITVLTLLFLSIFYIHWLFLSKFSLFKTKAASNSILHA